jgi:hypothetical protein
MRSPLILFLALGGSLVGVSAEASVIEYTSVDGSRAAAWTDAACSALDPAKQLEVRCVDKLDQVSKSALGPGGGILLAKSGAYAFEVNPKTNGVYRVKTDKGGKVIEKTFVVKIKLPARRKLQTLVAGRIEQAVDAAALVDRSVQGHGARLTLTYIVGSSSTDYERFELSYDVEGLQPLGARAKRPVEVIETPPTYWLPTYGLTDVE